MNSSFPRSSHVLPMEGRVLPKADLRKETTAFRLLIWAYRDECVRAAVGDSEPGRMGQGNGAFLAKMSDGGPRGSTLPALLNVAEDALTVDAFVWEWMMHSPTRYLFVARAAEKGRGIMPAADLPPLRVVPVTRANGNMEMIYPSEVSHRPCGCAIAYEGVDDGTRARHHELHTLWRAMLTALVGRRFVQWRVTAEGA